MEMFAMLDRDNSGTITCLELAHSLQSMHSGLDESEIEDVVQFFDKNGHGAFDVHDFKLTIQEMHWMNDHSNQ